MSTEPPAPARRRRSAEDAQSHILDAAQALLVETGPQALKLADIARRADVSNASVLHHFGSVDQVQRALMERMVRDLVAAVIAAVTRVDDPARVAGESTRALFAAFEDRAAARLAAWLELTGETGRFALVRDAVAEVLAARTGLPTGVAPDLLEDFILACVACALGVGLFGATLGAALGKPPERAREATLSLLLSGLTRAIDA